MSELIRRATEADIPRVVEMGARWWHEGPYASEPVDLAVATRTAMALLASNDGCILVTEKDGDLVGVFAFTAYAHWLTGLRIASELIWYVEPEHRAFDCWPGPALRLLHAAEEEAKRMSIALQVAAPFGSQVGQILTNKRVGYRGLESFYQKDFLCHSPVLQ